MTLLLSFLIIQEKVVFAGWIERVSYYIKWGIIPTTNEEAFKTCSPGIGAGMAQFH